MIDENYEFTIKLASKALSSADLDIVSSSVALAFAVKTADRLHNLQSALVAGVEFKKKCILETVTWYLDFSLDIKKAVKTLAESLDTPMVEVAFLYNPIETWKL